MALIIFSHGNSFPASTYSVLLAQLREQGHTVDALEKFGHNPAYPVTSNWPHLVNELADFARPIVAERGEPAYLVGHSLGGFLSVMVASQCPELVRGVVLLDAPILGGWRARVLAFAKLVGLIERFSPGKISQNRRVQWRNLADAQQHFNSKKLFAHWDAQVLTDYVSLCTHDNALGQRVLGFQRDVETAIYNTLPHHLSYLLRKNPLKCGVAFIGGKNSREMRQVGMDMTHQLAGTRVQMLAGTHLFPMETPYAAAQAIANALDSLAV